MLRGRSLWKCRSYCAAPAELLSSSHPSGFALGKGLVLTASLKECFVRGGLISNQCKFVRITDIPQEAAITTDYTDFTNVNKTPNCASSERSQESPRPPGPGQLKHRPSP
jgi:hypothetical protein